MCTTEKSSKGNLQSQTKSLPKKKFKEINILFVISQCYMLQQYYCSQACISSPQNMSLFCAVHVVIRIEVVLRLRLLNLGSLTAVSQSIQSSISLLLSTEPSILLLQTPRYLYIKTRFLEKSETKSIKDFSKTRK